MEETALAGRKLTAQIDVHFVETLAVGRTEIVQKAPSIWIVKN